MATYRRLIFLQEKFINNYHVGLFRNYSSKTHTVKSTKTSHINTDIPVVIPARIKRGPTDILEALASTVSRDYTAPHFKYHDDPYFIPASNIAKRSYALSKESGREAARWILQNNPTLFAPDAAKPHIPAFMPPKKYDEMSDDADVNTLRFLIKESRIQEAISVYNTLKKKEEIDGYTLQELLELMCFFNCQDSMSSESMEKMWYTHRGNKEKRRTWLDKGAAELLFNSMKSPGAEAYSALVIGMARYLQVDRAFQLYQEMIEKQLLVSVDVYNALLQIVLYLREGSENRWQLVEELLAKMDETGVIPNLNTFNAVLECTTKLGNPKVAKGLALNTLSEMKHLNIEPCLASYYYLLVLFCKERGPTSGILYDIMEKIDGKDLTIKHPKDLFFFVTAMGVCHDHVQDKELAYRVYRLLLHGNNGILIGDAMKESVFYQHFFRLLCATEDINSFFELYYKLVPNIYTPEPSVMDGIIQAVEINQAWQYVPQIWSDLVLFGQVYRTNIIDGMLRLLANNKPENKELQEQFVRIALDMRERINGQYEDKLRSIVHWTGQMLGDIMLTCLNGDNYDKAYEVFQQCEKGHTTISGSLSIAAIESLISAAVSRKEEAVAIACLHYASDAGYSEVKTLVQVIQEGLTLTEAQQLKVTDIALTSTDKEET